MTGGRFTGNSYVRGPSWFNLPALTICFLGVQLCWSVEMSNASPYLLSLGLTKSAMAVVFVAGPLSGFIVQPLIGVLSDSSTSRWGRRRPYMLMGALLCAIALLLLGWTRVVVEWFTSNSSTMVVILAVFSVFVIDFSINAVQAMDRALLVDTLPSSLQPAGNAWAAKMLAIGSVVGFFIGEVDLPKAIPFLGSTQLHVLSLIGSVVLLSAHFATSVLVQERVLVEKQQSGRIGPIQKFTQELKDIWNNLWMLPRVIRQICMVQFFAWLGWFPILFYTSVYIGDLNKRAFHATLSVIPPPGSPVTDITPEILLALDEESSRLGSRALFYSSLITLFMNFALPYFVTEASTNSRKRRERRHQQTVANGFGSTAHLNGEPIGGGGFVEERLRGSSASDLLRRVTSFAIPERLQLQLSSLWAVSHAVFALAMFGTFFTSSVFGATFLIALTGFSWAVTQWVPFALLGEAILTEPSTLMDDGTSIRLTDTRHRRSGSVARASSESRRELAMLDGRAPFAISGEEDESDDEDRKHRTEEARAALLGNSNAGVSRVDIPDTEQYQHEEDDEDEGAVLVGRRRTDEEGNMDVDGQENASGLSAKAGIILGIHNIFIVIPQFLVTGISSIIFALLDPSKSVLHGKPLGTVNRTDNITEIASAAVRHLLHRQTDEDAILEELAELEAASKSNTVVYIFRMGGAAALIAFILSWRLSRELRHR